MFAIASGLTRLFEALLEKQGILSNQGSNITSDCADFYRYLQRSKLLYHHHRPCKKSVTLIMTVFTPCSIRLLTLKFASMTTL